MKTETRKHYVGPLEITLISDVDGGKTLDTHVKIGDTPLCWIAGEDIDRFITGFRDLVAEYSI